jgi:histidine triad (HIT) family protein
MADGRPQPDCLFCKIVAGEIPANVVRETEHTVAFTDINPQAPVHDLVVPRAHYANVAEFAAAAPELAAGLLVEAREVAKAEGIAAEGYRVVFNTDAHAGQTVFHVHAHVLGGDFLGHFGS